MGVEAKRLGLEKIDVALEEAGTDLNFTEIVSETAESGVAISPKAVLSKVINMIFSEVVSQISLVKKIIFIAILCGFLKTLEDSFGGKEVTELGFYVCYILLIYIVMSSFYENSKMVLETSNRLIILLKQMIPCFITIMALSGIGAQGVIMGPFIMGAAGILSWAIQGLFIPLISLTAMLEIANNIAEKGLLGRLSQFFKSFIAIGLKGCAILFMAVAGLQKTGAVGISGVVSKTAKGMITAVPVVGDIMSGAVETAAGLTGLLRSSVTVATVVVVCIIVMTPVIKLFVMYIIYKLTAAVIEPVSEPRLVKALSSAGDFLALLMGAIFVVSSMFVFSTIILLTVI